MIKEEQKFSNKEEVSLVENEIHVKTKDFNSRYIFESNKDAKAVFSTLDSNFNGQLIGGPIVKYSMKNGKLEENSRVSNKVEAQVNSLTQKLWALKFAVSLYDRAYVLTEVRPWWCSSYYPSIKEYEATLKASDVKNKYKFAMFMAYESWIKESAWATEFYSALKNKVKNKSAP